MGGHAAGEVASQLAIETLFAEYYGDTDYPMPPAMRLEQVILVANGRIHEQAASKMAQAGMGTTVVAAVVRDDWLIVGNVGDSRAYLVRDGESRQITRDHSWVAEQVAAGLLTEQEAQNHMYRSVVTRCLGHRPETTVDTFEHALEHGDVVLLCSDGLSNQVSEIEIAQIVTQGSPEQAVRDLVDLANRYGGCSRGWAAHFPGRTTRSKRSAACSAAAPDEPDQGRGCHQTRVGHSAGAGADGVVCWGCCPEYVGFGTGEKVVRNLNANADLDANSNLYGNPHSDADRYCYGDRHRNPDCHVDVDGYPDANRDPDRHRDPDSYPDANAVPGLRATDFRVTSSQSVF
jgi:serine/threonine protein phosphatase PrpC